MLDMDTQPIATDDTAQDASGSPSESSTQRSPSPRKIACYFCRHRKLRCDGVRPVCGNCTRRSNVCGYDEQLRKRGPDKVPGGRKRKVGGETEDVNGPGGESTSQPPEEQHGSDDQAMTEDTLSSPHNKEDEAADSRTETQRA